jgi:hypothetical protein
MDGFECASDQACNGEELSASDVNLCCSEECKSKSNLLPFIIIAIVLVLGAAGFFLYKKGFFDKYFKKKPKSPPSPMTQYRPPVYPLQPQQPQMQVQQPIHLQVKVQPRESPRQPPQQQFQPIQRREGIKREMKSELDETLKKLKKLSEEK